MKIWEKIVIMAIIALCGVIAGFGWGYSKMYVKCYKKEPTVVYVPKEKIVHDTITDIQYRNIYRVYYDTAWMERVDTLPIHDTVQVIVPIERKSFDTITADSIHVYGSISGYKANIDTLMVEGKTVQNNIIINQPEERRFHWGWGFAIGFGWVK